MPCMRSSASCRNTTLFFGWTTCLFFFPFLFLLQRWGGRELCWEGVEYVLFYGGRRPCQSLPAVSKVQKYLETVVGSCLVCLQRTLADLITNLLFSVSTAKFTSALIKELKLMQTEDWDWSISIYMLGIWLTQFVIHIQTVAVQLRLR